MKSKIGFLTVLYAHVLLIPWYDALPVFIYRYGSFLLSVIIFINLYNVRKYVFSAQNKRLIILLLLLTISTIYTSINVNNINVNSIVLHGTNKLQYDNNGVAFGVTTALKVLLSFIFVQYIIARKYVDIFIKYLYYVLFFYIIISDMEIVLFGIQESGSGYFLGNKFTVSYLHLFFATIYKVHQMISNSNHNYYVPLLFLALIVAIALHCSTSVVGVLLLFVFHYFKNIRDFIVYNKLSFIILITSSILFAFFYPYILQVPFIQYIIVNILGEDLTLTGRTYIYDAVLNVIELNPLWGMGIGNAYHLLSYLYGFPNAQNGFINLFLEQGIIGCSITMIITIYLITMQSKKKCSGITIPFICLTFTMIFLAFVEITIDLSFVFLLTLLLITDSDIKESIGRTNIS